MPTAKSLLSAMLQCFQMSDAAAMYPKADNCNKLIWLMANWLEAICCMRYRANRTI